METKHSLPNLVRRAGASLGEHMTDLQHQIDRLFDDFSGRWSLPRLGNGDGHYWPALDMTESSDAVDVVAELPGVDPKDVDITVSGDTVTIKGEKKSEKETKDKDFYHAERSFGAFTRSLALPFEIDAGKVEASYDKGVLKLHIGKPPGVKKEVKKIPVKAA
ncbi:MAG: Hsp20/alpha crystallin family protein [Alphaproteobacteria bacterium]|nr:Hsp20/alpha crystallin family protein [Alphaproteobacteria bacterium]